MYIDRDQFYDSPGEHLQNHKSPAQVKTWINMVKSTIDLSKQQIQELMTKNIKKLQHYFSISFSSNCLSQIKEKIIEKSKVHQQTYIFMEHYHKSFSYNRIYQAWENILTLRKITPGILWSTTTQYQSSIINKELLQQ